MVDVANKRSSESLPKKQETMLEYANRRFQRLKTKHDKRMDTYQELSEYINPTRGMFFDTRDKINERIDHTVLIRSHATHAQRIFASGMNAGMTNKSSEWFELTTHSKEKLEVPGVKAWLDEVQKGMYSVLNESNLYGVFYHAYEEMGQFGPACYLVLPDMDTVVRGRSFTAGEYYIATDKNGMPDTFARGYQMTVEQMVDEFGIENCSSVVHTHWQNNELDTLIWVRHLIEPNKDRSPNRIDSRNMAYRSLYWEKGSNVGEGNGDQGFLAIRGYDKFPVVAPRWETITTDDDYGYAPGWHALGAIKELQKTARDKLLAQEKTHNPPMVQDDQEDVFAELVPGGVTKMDLKNGVKGALLPAYQIDVRLESFIQLLEEEKEEIDKFFFVNLFLMLLNSNNGQMTATEVAQRKQEQIMMMGPALHRLDKEMLTVTLELIYYYMDEAGMIPEPPPELDGQPLKIVFTSILAQAQKAVGIIKIERMVDRLAVMAQIQPDVLDNVDFDEMLREIADLDGLPAKIIKERGIVEKIRELRAQQQQLAMAADVAKTGADAAAKLSQAKTDTPSLLKRMYAGV